MRWLAIVAVLALAACEKEHSRQEQAVRDAHAVAAVERINQAAIKPLAPQMILFPDIENNQLDGSGCAFATQGDLGAVLLTRKDRAYMKLADKIAEFSADAGSAQLPAGARSKYRGNDLVLQFTIDAPDGANPGAAQGTYPGRLIAHDLDGNVVFNQPGSVQCGA
jgi:hypothetical protein